MKQGDKILRVAFIDTALKKSFEGLETGKYEHQQLLKFLKRAIKDLKKNPFCGVRVASKLWPKEYVKKYEIDNLWKYDLPDGWRLVYTVKGNDLEIISIFIEWFDHKSYEKRFKY